MTRVYPQAYGAARVRGSVLDLHAAYFLHVVMEELMGPHDVGAGVVVVLFRVS